MFDAEIGNAADSLRLCLPDRAAGYHRKEEKNK
jgi:hypothetical protein